MAVQIVRPIPLNPYFADAGKTDCRYTSIAIRFVWENVGKSPAKCTNLFTSYRVIAMGDPIPTFTDPGGARTVTSCPPGRVKYSGDQSVSAAEYASVIAKTHRLIVHSRIEYEVHGDVSVTKHSESTIELMVNAAGREQDDKGVTRDRFSDRVVGTQQDYT